MAQIGKRWVLLFFVSAEALGLFLTVTDNSDVFLKPPLAPGTLVNSSQFTLPKFVLPVWTVRLRAFLARLRGRDLP